MAILKAVGSSRLALALVILLILFSVAGALLPQEGLFGAADIDQWQKSHPMISRLMQPLGLFRVFHSLPFLVIIILLALNTLACTAVYTIKEGGLSALRGPAAVRNLGFILLHLSLIGLMAGGFLSAALRLDGYIILTEGQEFREIHRGYTRLQEGPLRREHHAGFALRLEKVQVGYAKDGAVAGITSSLMLTGNDVKNNGIIVQVNRPFTYRGFSFTQDQTGFSPRLLIRHRQSGRIMVNSFLALKTFVSERAREYRDFLPLPLFKKRLIVTLFPDYTLMNGQVKKNGEEPDQPLLLIEMEDENARPQSVGRLLPGKTMAIDDYEMAFTGLRRWSSFRVVHDPGYPVTWIALWLGVAALVLRYIPDLARWFRQPGSECKDEPAEPEEIVNTAGKISRSGEKNVTN